MDKAQTVKPQLTEEEASFLDEQITKEIIENERKRAFLLGVIALIFFIVLVLFILLGKTDIFPMTDELIPIYITGGILMVMIWRARLINGMLNHPGRLQKLFVIKRKQKIIRYGWLFWEISIPTFLLFIYSKYTTNPGIITSPIGWFYFILIILSTLSLDFWMSLFCGAVAALEYMIYIFFVTKIWNWVSVPADLFVPITYWSIIILLLLSGAAAGFVAYQLRKRIYNTYMTILERNRIINLFDQQVSKEIVDELVENFNQLSSKRKFVCVMFLDIRNFTPFAEHKEPEEIIAYQNQIFSFMIEIITKNHGIINQFLGDGYMATFGAPVSKGNDCANAVKAAMEIIETVNMKSEKGEIPYTRIGIGLHAGNIVAGNVGTSIRKQYSISGNTVILASRIEDLTKNFKAQLLISKEVLDNIKIEEVQPEFQGSVILKGRENPVDIYKLM